MTVSGAIGRACACLAMVFACAAARAECNGFDHKVPFDNSGIWKRSYQLAVVNGVVLVDVAGALWEGGETRLGRTYWQSVDSLALGAVTSEALKHIVQRPRPAQGGDCDDVREGNNHYSFPSGEVTAVTAGITPFVLEYGHDYPAVYGLYALPLYDAVARVKSNAHWQSDVLAGFALGSLTGYLAHERDSPFILNLLPGGFEVGLRAKF